MPPSDATKKVTVYVEAPDSATQVQLLDAALQPVALETTGARSALGALEVAVAPGAYTARLTRGGWFKDTTFIVDEREARYEKHLGEEDAPLMSTPTPLRKTPSTREIHRQPAKALSQVARDLHGPGMQQRLFVFVRDLDDKRSGNAAKGLRVQEADGHLLFDFDKDADVNEADGWAGANLGVRPGPYIIECAFASGRRDRRYMYVAEGWQTQVFLFSDRTARERRASMARMSVMMAKVERGFEFDWLGQGRPDVLWTETALRALRGQGALERGLSSLMYAQKFENPMLGIYAALLHLRSARANAALLHAVAANLIRLIGATPDVMAVGLGALMAGESARAADRALIAERSRQALRFPPMLLDSWRLIVAARAAGFPGIVRGSPAEDFLGEATMARPWFTSSEEPQSPFKALVDEPADAFDFGRPFELAEVDLDPYLPASQRSPTDQLRRLARRLRGAPKSRVRRLDLTRLEGSVAQLAWPLVDPRVRTWVELGIGKEDDVAIDALSDEELREEAERRLGIPMDIAADAAQAVIDKLAKANPPPAGYGSSSKSGPKALGA